MSETSVACLLGQPALVQLVDKSASTNNEKEKKELLKKAETQCKSFDGKGKLTVDDYYSVLKVQCKVDLTKNDIRKVVADLPMDKNYKISVQDFCRTPILSDEVFKSMDRNNDGQISKGELKLARKNLTLKQIEMLISKLDADGNGTISLEELNNCK
eukprot:TRINITY_DN3795_c0_g1_i1.p1 TRINITY_DN3795_c0_g1~~TRINITY_DN3795_c0_g1_i1.p1  ORF type:complete len:157 (-),score=72.59 TRINITY_DN3795_c0_g1_i1:39-509(-)